jgi:hypothetical protein
MPPTQTEGVGGLERVSGPREYPETSDDGVANELAQTEPWFPERTRSGRREHRVAEEEDRSDGINVVFGGGESTYLRVACLKDVMIIGRRAGSRSIPCPGLARRPPSCPVTLA